MSLVISVPANMDQSEPSPCGGDMAPRAPQSREDILREMEKKVSVTHAILFNLNWEHGELVERLAWEVPNHLDSPARFAYLCEMPEYIASKAKIEAARAVFLDAAAARHAMNVV
jgi:hypothetical protein